MSHTRFGNRGKEHTLENAGYVYTPLSPQSDIWANDRTDLNFRAFQKDHMHTGVQLGLPQLASPETAQAELITSDPDGHEPEKDKHEAIENQSSTTLFIAAAIIIAAFAL